MVVPFERKHPRLRDGPDAALSCLGEGQAPTSALVGLVDCIVISHWYPVKRRSPILAPMSGRKRSKNSAQHATYEYGMNASGINGNAACAQAKRI